MSYIRFEWNQAKAESSIAKHGIAFDEAATVFDDPYAGVINDPDHSFDEERFIILGMSMRVRELVVSHCLRGRGADTIRIMSARRAAKRESGQYWRYVNAQ